MVKARFHREPIIAGDFITLPDDAFGVTILHSQLTGAYTVAWLEEVKE